MDVEKEKTIFTVEEVIKLQTEILDELKKVVKIFSKDLGYIKYRKVKRLEKKIA